MPRNSTFESSKNDKKKMKMRRIYYKSLVYIYL